VNTQTKGFLLVLLSAAGFGSMPVFARLAYQDGANMFELLTARFLVAGLVLVLYLRLKKVPALGKQERNWAIAMGLCGYGVASLCFFSALQRIPAPMASIILFTYPAVVTLFLVLSGAEKLGRYKGGALLLSAAGLALVMGSALNSANTKGMLLALLASLLFSTYILLGNRFLRNAPLAAATAWISWSAAIGFGAYGLLSGSLVFRFGLWGWLGIACLALFSTVVAIFSFLQGVMLIGASRASIISTMEPPITVLLAAVFLAETLTHVQLLGGVLVLSSAILVNRSKKETVAAAAQAVDS
jgi:drug/metabolite transporter (DMT)-like permease